MNELFKLLSEIGQIVAAVIKWIGQIATIDAPILEISAGISVTALIFSLIKKSRR